MTFNDPLDLLIYHTIEFCRRPAPGFFEQKRAVIADFPGQGGGENLAPLQLIFHLDLDGNIEVILEFFEIEAGSESLDHPNHIPDRIRTFFGLSGINFTSFCPDMTIS